MKLILFIDRDSSLARSVRSLAHILDIPFDLVTRKNDVRRFVATGNVGMIFANTEITTIRYDDMVMEIDAILKRNRHPEIPTYYICDDSPFAGENMPKDVPGSYLIKRSSSLENIYSTIEKTLLSDHEIEQSGGFILYTEEHTEFINSYERILINLSRIAEKIIN
ncbi:MAG: hypothetical protein U9Q77_03605 [Candidatus Marinimicrobia bacterium]|nr:hypothetical protein [Candidatus Neomarinimicrobiota bacterium]